MFENSSALDRSDLIANIVQWKSTEMINQIGTMTTYMYMAQNIAHSVRMFSASITAIHVMEATGNISQHPHFRQNKFPSQSNEAAVHATS